MQDFYTGDELIVENTIGAVFPSDENPRGMWPYMTVNFSMDTSFRQVSRQTYSLLDWCGDWGGLLDALFLIAEILVYPVSVHELYARVASVSMTATTQSSKKTTKPSSTSFWCRALKRNREALLLQR